MDFFCLNVQYCTPTIFFTFTSTHGHVQYDNTSSFHLILSNILIYFLSFKKSETILIFLSGALQPTGGLNITSNLKTKINEEKKRCYCSGMRLRKFILVSSLIFTQFMKKKNWCKFCHFFVGIELIAGVHSLQQSYMWVSILKSI